MDTEKAKEFIIHNFEKAIVGVVVLMALVLIFLGSRKPVITSTYDPDAEKSKATNVRRRITEVDNRASIMSERRETVFDIKQQTAGFKNSIASKDYAMGTLDSTINVSNKVRREDPALAKPVGIMAHGFLGSMALASPTGMYEIKNLEAAGELEKEEKRRPRRRTKPKAPEPGEGAFGEGYGEDGGGFGEIFGDSSGGGGEGEGEGMFPPMGGGNFSNNPVRRLASEATNGFTPAETNAPNSTRKQIPAAFPAMFIGGTAAIPHADLINAYQKALSYAADYQPIRRDRPVYLAYEVQRADVTNKSVDQLTDKDWILRDTNTQTIKLAANYWCGFAPEVVPPDYWVNGVTMWIPPVLVDPYKSFAINPLIPLKTQRELEMEALAEQPVEETDVEQEIIIGGGGTSGVNYGEGMMGGEGEMGMGGEAGFGGDDMRYQGGVASMQGLPAEEDPVQHKLLRFYDFRGLDQSKPDKAPIQMGRKYVYRIRYAVEDPNFPRERIAEPKSKHLATAAFNRVSALRAKSEQSNNREFTLWSPWSDPSAPVSLPGLEQSFAGPVEKVSGRWIDKDETEVFLESTPPSAEMVIGKFQFPLANFANTRMDVTRGSVLTAKAEKPEIIDPITLEVKAIDNEVVIDSSATVIDLKGGLKMPLQEDNDDEDLITEPDFILMTDSNGNLKVRDAIEEQRIYRYRSFATERNK
ncbi:hypothetical protein SV7mr_36140 [Stieleria bergensis]|uniref:Uncharacterized protein n=1 Tax=Stieleria bergensis TaxID=2528025 RepID=A0A517SYE1_9BACT|nr:hypothetical protein SV7mr_36140 [Planctomycetes bacterium SV_7m_r]